MNAGPRGRNAADGSISSLLHCPEGPVRLRETYGFGRFEAALLREIPAASRASRRATPVWVNAAGWTIRTPPRRRVLPHALDQLVLDFVLEAGDLVTRSPPPSRFTRQGRGENETHSPLPQMG